MKIQLAHTCRPKTALVCATLAECLTQRLLRGSGRADASPTAALQHPCSRPNTASDRESGLESP